MTFTAIFPDSGRRDARLTVPRGSPGIRFLAMRGGGASSRNAYGYGTHSPSIVKQVLRMFSCAQRAGGDKG